MAKEISKSIRLSNEIYDYIMEFEGNGFNEKFENIIVFSIKTELERRKRLSDVEKLIKERTQELSDLNDNLYKARIETYKYKQIMNDLKFV